MERQNINWEERRFIVSTQILAGMCANYHHGYCPSAFRAEDAVKLADSLIQILSDPTRPSLCSELYHQSSDLSK